VVPRPVHTEPFLLPPATGYPLLASAEVERQTAAAFERLRFGEDLAAIAADADRLLAEAPDYHPAAVLRAQVDVLRQDFRRAADRLGPIAGELPEYVACQVLRGHAAEALGELRVAFEAYSKVAAGSGHAAARAAEIGPRTVEVVFRRLEQALERGRFEDAEDERRWLDEWIADEQVSLRASYRILAASGDAEGELQAVCRLAELDPVRELLQRCGELQVEVGEPRAGLEIFERLIAEEPDDAALQEYLERAKFRWRLELLPPAVGELGRKPALERADLATLLYWLVPQVRASQISNPPIATDILESPRRDEILRVVSLGLMRVNEDLHLFDPARAATRLDVLAALLRLLDAPDRRYACLADTPARSLTASIGWVCDRAARCGLIAEAAECLPRASISGSEALELFRRSLELSSDAGPAPAQDEEPS
jgi:tetratricopeptide (TPR) repeat protein